MAAFHASAWHTSTVTSHATIFSASSSGLIASFVHGTATTSMSRRNEP